MRMAMSMPPMSSQLTGGTRTVDVFLLNTKQVRKSFLTRSSAPLSRKRERGRG